MAEPERETAMSARVSVSVASRSVSFVLWRVEVVPWIGTFFSSARRRLPGFQDFGRVFALERDFRPPPGGGGLPGFQDFGLWCFSLEKRAVPDSGPQDREVFGFCVPRAPGAGFPPPPHPANHPEGASPRGRAR